MVTELPKEQKSYIRQDIIRLPEYKLLNMDTLFPTELTFIILEYMVEYKDIFIKSFGSRGRIPGQFSYPFGITNHKNKIYIVDRYNDRVQIFNTDGTYISSIKDLKYPQIIQEYNDKIYILDDFNICVYVQDKEYTTLESLGFNNGIIFFTIAHNIIYVIQNDKYISTYNLEGKILKKNINNVILGEATSLLVLENKILVADNEIIREFNLDGTFIKDWKDTYTCIHSITKIDNEIYVCEYYENHGIHVLDLEGNTVRKISNKDIPGLRLYNPYYMTYCNKKIFVTCHDDTICIFERTLIHFV